MRKGVDLLIGIRELKAYLHVGTKTLDRLVTEENFPVHKIQQGTGQELWISSHALIQKWLAEKIKEQHGWPSLTSDFP